MNILITGGTNGMGKGLAKALASAGRQDHEIIILCRSEKLGKAVVGELESASPDNNNSYILCNLTRLGDVGNAIEEIRRRHTRAFLSDGGSRSCDSPSASVFPFGIIKIGKLKDYLRDRGITVLSGS